MNSWTKLKSTNLPIAGLALALVFVSGCERALVFADRTGVNLAVRSDMAEGSPLEVNAGLKRRVVGFVPAKGESEDGRPSGEAVNMVSRFDLKRTKGIRGAVFGQGSDPHQFRIRKARRSKRRQNRRPLKP